jgi:hypothetical protein
MKIRCAVCGSIGDSERPGWLQATADLKDMETGKTIVHVAEHLCPRHAIEAKKAAKLEDEDGIGKGTGHEVD